MNGNRAGGPALKYLLTACILAISANSLFADEPSTTIELPSQFVCKVIQDPKTKVIFYLESDRHHLSAISPRGILLWQVDTWSKEWLRSWTWDCKQFTESPRMDQIKDCGLINFLGPCKSKDLIGQRGNPDDFLTVDFNCGEIGLFRKSTGEYLFELQL